jgi:hypothetical protein
LHQGFRRAEREEQSLPILAPRRERRAVYIPFPGCLCMLIAWQWKNDYGCLCKRIKQFRAVRRGRCTLNGVHLRDGSKHSQNNGRAQKQFSGVNHEGEKLSLLFQAGYLRSVVMSFRSKCPAQVSSLNTKAPKHKTPVGKCYHVTMQARAITL